MTDSSDTAYPFSVAAMSAVTDDTWMMSIPKHLLDSVSRASSGGPALSITEWIAISKWQSEEMSRAAQEIEKLRRELREAQRLAADRNVALANIAQEYEGLKEALQAERCPNPNCPLEERGVKRYEPSLTVGGEAAFMREVPDGRFILSPKQVEREKGKAG